MGSSLVRCIFSGKRFIGLALLVAGNIFQGCGSNDTSDSPLFSVHQSFSGNSRYRLKVGTSDAWLTAKMGDPIGQPDGDRCLVSPGAELLLKTYRPRKNGYLEFVLSSPLSNCALVKAFALKSLLTPVESLPVAEPDDTKNFVKIGDAATFFKISKEQSSKLQVKTQKCALAPDETIYLSVQPTVSNDHYRIRLEKPLKNCNFQEGFIFIPHVTAVGGLGVRSQARDAFLAVVAYAEGTDGHYDIFFGGSRFTSFSDHPRKVICSSGLCSSAAGRFQFLSTTWDNCRGALALNDFSPLNQDRGALWLMEQKGLTDLRKNLTLEEFDKDLRMINTEWASMPGSPYGQPTKSVAELWVKYQEALNKPSSAFVGKAAEILAGADLNPRR